ncbi:predicted protein [Histoplasma capsulatum G186AR]|uniref:Uncharacterized protein n=1 Tax=Ajellomyces capsulatus (strain G186AR / H82 / ATCC MYA-2454 / RMSCC 2432) TaxID=447093 RepID=C0NKS7_AJECG|nr:uncharacterized protein HCBG_03757 [Histoplasma capsulatum G186AR]EEH08468.1 predicted protein [Histoplasma capsulatum G186AR]
MHMKIRDKHGFKAALKDGLGSFISRVRVEDAKFWSSHETSERLLERKKGGAGSKDNYIVFKCHMILLTSSAVETRFPGQYTIFTTAEADERNGTNPMDRARRCAVVEGNEAISKAPLWVIEVIPFWYNF